MIFILGFRTPNSDEIPEILYLGNDGDEALKAAESAPHPRVAKMVNPRLYPIRHWSEEAAAAFSAPAEPVLPSAPHETPAAPAPAEAAESAPAEVAGLEAPADGASLAEADEPEPPKKRR